MNQNSRKVFLSTSFTFVQIRNTLIMKRHFYVRKKKEMTIQCLVKDNKKSRGGAKLLYRTVKRMKI